MKFFNFFRSKTSVDLNRFNTAFTATANDGAEGDSVDFDIENLALILNALGGKTFNHGIYRVLHSRQVSSATAELENVFPEYRGRIVPFAFDWLGRYFACDRKRIEKGQPQVLLLEVGMGEAMQIDASIVDFHNVELVDFADDALAGKLWREWRTRNPADLSFKDCVGYKHLPILGGADELANLELTDMDVYVHLCGQIRNQVKRLPDGQRINRVTPIESDGASGGT